MRELTNFQTECEQSLNEALLGLGKRVDDRSLEGEHETFIHAKISNPLIEIWIYENEAMFSGDGFEFHFEAPDYPKRDKLISEFVETIASCIQGDIPKKAGSGFIGIIRGDKL